MAKKNPQEERSPYLEQSYEEYRAGLVGLCHRILFWLETDIRRGERQDLLSALKYVIILEADPTEGVIFFWEVCEVLRVDAEAIRLRLVADAITRGIKKQEAVDLFFEILAEYKNVKICNKSLLLIDESFKKGDNE